MPAPGSPAKFSHGASEVMRPRWSAPSTVWWSSISPSHCSNRSAERSDELVVDGLVDDRRAQRRAALPGGAEATEQGALDRERDVGVGHDDHRVLAAELQARVLDVA